MQEGECGARHGGEAGKGTPIPSRGSKVLERRCGELVVRPEGFEERGGGEGRGKAERPTRHTLLNV